MLEEEKLLLEEEKMLLEERVQELTLQLEKAQVHLIYVLIMMEYCFTNYRHLPVL